MEQTLTNLINMALSYFTALSPSAQIITVALFGLLTLIPHIAPFTPWTLDDKTIKYKSRFNAAFLKLWNIAAGNWGKAKNADKK